MGVQAVIVSWRRKGRSRGREGVGKGEGEGEGEVGREGKMVEWNATAHIQRRSSNLSKDVEKNYFSHNITLGRDTNTGMHIKLKFSFYQCANQPSLLPLCMQI